MESATRKRSAPLISRAHAAKATTPAPRRITYPNPHLIPPQWSHKKADKGDEVEQLRARRRVIVRGLCLNHRRSTARQRELDAKVSQTQAKRKRGTKDNDILPSMSFFEAPETVLEYLRLKAEDSLRAFVRAIPSRRGVLHRCDVVVEFNEEDDDDPEDEITLGVFKMHYESFCTQHGLEPRPVLENKDALEEVRDLGQE